MLVGVLYWAGWRIVLPKIFGYNLVSHKEHLEDGTVVNVVRLDPCWSLRHVLNLLHLVQERKGCLESTKYVRRFLVTNLPSYIKVFKSSVLLL
jgi:hypothetical protein